MTYYAKTNTADPRTGFISTGEILTDAQVDALGEEKLTELVERGVLGIQGGTAKPAPKKPAPVDEPDDEPEDEPEEADEAEEAEEADDEDDLPTLDAGDVIEDEAPAKPTTKRGGRKGK